MLKELFLIFKRHPREEVDPHIAHIERLRETRKELKRLDQDAANEINELMVEQLRRAGL